MIETFDAIQNRRSIRRFIGRWPIAPAKLKKLEIAALSAPSARDCQPWKFVFVSNQKLLDKIAGYAVEELLDSGDKNIKATLESRNYSIFYEAPTVIFIFGDKNNKWSSIDCGIAVQNIALEAYADGLGSCIIGLVSEAFKRNPKLYETLGVPPEYEFKISIAVGTPGMTKPAHKLDDDKISYLK